MSKRKSFEELKFTDDFMFAARLGVGLQGGGQDGLGPGGAAADHLDGLVQAAAAAQ